MIVKIADIWNLQQATSELSQRGEQLPLAVLSSVRLSAAKSYRLGKQIEVIAREMAALEKARVALIQRLGVERKDADGNVVGHHIEQGSENWKTFVAEVEELCDGNVEIPDGTLTLDDLGETPISAAALNAVSFLIEAEPATKAATVTNIKNAAKKRSAA